MMVLFTMCRLCLVEDVRMHSIDNTYLQEMYEKLTGISFNTQDGRPLQACYICCARLRNSFQLRVTCLQSEELLTQMLESDRIKPILTQDTNKLKVVHPLVNLDCGVCASNNHEDSPIIDNNYVKINSNGQQDCVMDPIDNIFDIEVTVGSDDEANDDSIKLIESQYTGPKGTLRIEDISLEDNNDSITETRDTSSKTGELYIENNIEPNHSIPSIKSKDVCSKTVKIILNRINMDGIKASSAAAEKENHAVVNEKYQNISYKSKTEVTCDQTKNITNKIQTRNKHPRKKRKVKESSQLGMQNSEKSFKCDICEKSFSQRYPLFIHIRSHTGEKPYKCELCEKSFSVISKLTRHHRLHTNEKPYKCDVCEKCFRHKHDVVVHKRIHTLDKPYKCDKCDKCFNQKQLLTYHYMCVHTGLKPYKCDKCDKYFTLKQNLNIHISRHSEEKPYKCNVCGKCFSFKRDLKVHTRIHTGEKPYKCKICEKCFSRTGDLNNHIRIHTGEKPYKCNICEKSFRLWQNLDSHIRVHTREKPYKCDICNKYYSQKQYLNIHTRIHTGEKPYKCDICEKSFSDKISLIKHSRVVHFGE